MLGIPQSSQRRLGGLRRDLRHLLRLLSHRRRHRAIHRWLDLRRTDLRHLLLLLSQRRLVLSLLLCLLHLLLKMTLRLRHVLPELLLQLLRHPWIHNDTAGSGLCCLGRHGSV